MALSYHVQLNGFLADFEAKRSPYDDSGSDSGDQFRPAEHPESEDEDDYLEDNVEPEAELEHEDEAKSEPTKAKSKKGKLKLGHKDIIAPEKPMQLQECLPLPPQLSIWGPMRRKAMLGEISNPF